MPSIGESGKDVEGEEDAKTLMNRAMRGRMKSTARSLEKSDIVVGLRGVEVNGKVSLD